MNSTEPQSGKPPKSAEQIAARLSGLARSAATPSGPLEGGLASETRLIVGKIRSRPLAKRLQQRLLERGIMSEQRRAGGYVEILVDYSDREVAFSEMASHLKDDPDVVPQSLRRPWDYVILGFLIGAAVGFSLRGGDFRTASDMLFTASFGFFGSLLASLLEGMLARYRRTGRIQVGARELLLLVTLPAVAVFIWSLISDWRLIGFIWAAVTDWFQEVRLRLRI